MDEIDEAELVGAGRSGAVVEGAAGDVRRAVRAALLRKCCHELRDQIDPRGLRLRNVVVLGSLDLAGLQVPFPLRFEDCEFDSPLLVEGAELFELSLTGCPRLPGLLGNGLRLRRDLDLSRSRIVGALWTSASTSKRAAVWLCESEIGGRLICLDATIDAEGDRAIQADRIVVGGAVRLIHQFSARGEIRMIGARIGGSLDITGARIEATDGPAFDLGGATIAGNVFVIEDPSGRRPFIRGRFDMGSGRIAGRFVIRNATLEARADESMGSIYAKSTTVATTISAERLSVGADVMLAGRCEVKGCIDLSMGDLSSVSVGGDCALRTPGRTALDLTNAEIRGTFRLHRRAVIEGTLRLEGAIIRGSLGLHGQMSRPENKSLVGASALTVDGDVYLDRLRADGGAGQLPQRHAGQPVRRPLRAAQPRRVLAQPQPGHGQGICTAGGQLLLDRAGGAEPVPHRGPAPAPGGSFVCPSPTPANEHGHAIEAISATARGGIDLGWKKVSPSVDFTDATTTFLADDPATWPERFAIAGLTYERFESPQGAKLTASGTGREVGLAGPPDRVRVRPVRTGREGLPAARVHDRGRAHPHRPAQARPAGQPAARRVAAARHRRRLRDHRLRVPAVAGAVGAGRAARPGHRLARDSRRPGHAAGQQRQRAGVRDERPADRLRPSGRASARRPAAPRCGPTHAATERCAASALCCTRSTPWSR